MAYTHSAAPSHSLAYTETTATKRATGPGFFSRLYAAFAAARMRQAERDIARYLHGSGSKFTDESEREIERRFLSNQRRW